MPVHSRWQFSSLALVGCAGFAWACGSFFPSDPVLTHREAAMLEAPEHSFTSYVQGLMPVEHPALTLNETDQDAASWEAANLPADHQAIVTRMRESGSAQHAFALGEGLPQELRHYVAGAVGFHAYRDDQGAESEALTHFQSVLDLPENNNRKRAAWAAWMMGRLHAESGSADRHSAAMEAFERTRQLVLAGADDPLGLAIASYGAQGLIALNEGDIPSAMRLYARQAAHGSLSGRNSLLHLGRHLLATSASAAELADPLTQRIVVAVALEQAEAEYQSWIDDAYLYESDDIEMDEAETGDSTVDENSVADDAADESPDHSAILRTLVETLAPLGAALWADPGTLAIAAYRAGMYEAAAGFADARSTPETELVKAKLALRRGESDAATAHYAASVRLRNERPLPKGALAANDQQRHDERVLAEWSSLALSRNSFIEALDLMLRAGPLYWEDAAYLAERILTTAELKQYVDETVPLRNQPDRRWRDILNRGFEAKQDEAEQDEAADDVENCWPRTACLNDSIRDLLARRLAREGRIIEAMPYYQATVFTSTEDEATPVPVAKLAREYARALHKAETAWRPLRRARARFEAATLAREFGMELMGYEFGPDNSVYEGRYTWSGPVEMPDAEAASPEERQRYAATTPSTEQPFHYRHTAAALAGQAADLLPARSQAFASVLCHAAMWVINEDNQAAQPYYRRYLREGAFVPWGEHFGRECPEPDFAAARKLEIRQHITALRNNLRPWKTPLMLASAAMVLTLLGGVLLTLRGASRARRSA